MDSFRAFWQDGWNVFDFLITFLTLLPELLALLPATSDGGALDSGLPKLGAQTATHTAATHAAADHTRASSKRMTRQQPCSHDATESSLLSQAHLSSCHHT